MVPARLSRQRGVLEIWNGEAEDQPSSEASAWGAEARARLEPDPKAGSLVLRRRKAASKDVPEGAVRRLLEHPSRPFACRKRRPQDEALLLKQALSQPRGFSVTTPQRNA